MVLNAAEISQKMNRNSLLSLEKNIIEEEKLFYTFLKSYSEKKDINIRKINCNSSSEVRIMRINKYLSCLIFNLFVINK